MKIPKLFGTKTNSSRQPRRCCHKENDGAECNATPQTGRQYCFFHDPDPALQEKKTAARKAGGVSRSSPLLLPPNLPYKSLQTASAVAELLDETINQVRQGEIDLRAATAIGYLSTILLNALETGARAKPVAAGADAPRAFSGKKLPYDHVDLTITDIATGEVIFAPGWEGLRSPPGTKDQLRQNGASPESAESKQDKNSQNGVSPGTRAAPKY
jgi:hypothetical protein